MKIAPMFLDRNFKRLGKVNNYLPPFGFKTQGKDILWGYSSFVCISVHNIYALKIPSRNAIFFIFVCVNYVV